MSDDNFDFMSYNRGKAGEPFTRGSYTSHLVGEASQHNTTPSSQGYTPPGCPNDVSVGQYACINFSAFLLFMGLLTLPFPFTRAISAVLLPASALLMYYGLKKKSSETINTEEKTEEKILNYKTAQIIGYVCSAGCGSMLLWMGTMIAKNLYAYGNISSDMSGPGAKAIGACFAFGTVTGLIISAVSSMRVRQLKNNQLKQLKP